MRHAFFLSLGFGSFIALFAACSDQSSDAQGNHRSNDTIPRDLRDAGNGPTDASNGHAVDSSVPAPRGKYAPVSAANDGVNALFVWQLETTDIVRVNAARVREDGTVLDPGGFSVHTWNNPQESQVVDNAAVAHSGTQFLVSWQRRTRPLTDGFIEWARVSRQGEASDSNGIVIDTAGEISPLSLAVAQNTNGTFAVGMLESLSTFETIPVDALGKAGAVSRNIPPSPFPSQNAYTFEDMSAVVAAAKPLFLCRVDGAKIQTGENTIDRVDCANGSLAMHNAIRTAAADTPVGLVAAWLDAPTKGVRANIKGGPTIALAGAGVDDAQFSQNYPWDLAHVGVGYDGTYIHVVWASASSPTTLLEQRLLPDGTIVDAAPLAIAQASLGFAVTCPGHTCMVGYLDENGVAVKRLTGTDVTAGPRIGLSL